MNDANLHLLLLLALLAEAGNDKDRSNGVFSRVASRATEAVVDVVDPDVIIEHVDVDAVLRRVDVNALLDRIDVNELLQRVDVNQLLDRVDVDELLQRVDVNELVDRVDVNALMSRVDVEAIVDRVDVKDIADRAGIPDIVQESTTGLARSALDVFRRQIVAIDEIVGRATYSLTRRDPRTRPSAPPNLEAEDDQVGKQGRGRVTGHYAGPVSRLLAFAADLAIVWFGFLLLAAGITFVVSLISSIEPSDSSDLTVVGLIVLLLWAFGYMWLTVSIAGRTLGMALVGLRILDRQGNPLTGRQAFVRTIVFPFSFLFFGLGFLGIFISPTRRTLHDAAAGSVVVYDWGDRPAEMPAPITEWVSRHETGDASDAKDD